MAKGKRKAVTQEDLPDAIPLISRPSKPVEMQTDDQQVATVDWEEPVVKVQKASLQELRIASEDFIKLYFSRPDAYKQSYKYEDIHLALGWSSSLIMFATALYGWYIPFVQSKQLVAVGTAIAIMLSSILWLYLRLIKKDIVFVGRRKTLAGRIETEHLTVHAKTLPKPVDNPPLLLVLKYSRSANAGKTVITAAERVQTVSYGEIFDSTGVLHKDVFARLLAELETDVTALSIANGSAGGDGGKKQ